MDMEGSQMLADQTDQDVALVRDPIEKSHRKDCAQGAEIAMPTRILTYAAPIQSLHARAKQRSVISLVDNVPTTRRQVACQPERTLEAPGFEDDFYTNLLCWSSTNCVAIGLRDQTTPDSNVHIWNASSGQVHSLDPSEHRVLSISWSLDGLLLAMGLETGECKIWDLESNEIVRTLKFAHPSPIPALSWSENLFVCGSKSGKISFHDLRIARHLVDQKEAHTSAVCSVQLRGDGTRVASGGNDQYIKVFDLRMPHELMKYRHRAPVKVIAVNWRL